MANKLKRRQKINLRIEKVAFGGKGIAHADEYVVFVDNVLPGDVISAQVSRARKNYAEAFPLEFIELSPLRQAAPCEHFGHCGGCKWQNIPYEQQLQFKKQHVEESLRHIGNLSPEIIHNPIPSPLLFGYRNKMEFSFSESRWLTPEELKNPQIKKGFAVGFHAPRFYNRVIDIRKCWLQSDLLNQVLLFSKEYFQNTGLPVYHLQHKNGILRHLVLRQSFAEGKVLVNVVTFSPILNELRQYADQLTAKFPPVSSVINTINSRPAQIAAGEEQHVVYGTPFLYEKLGEFQFEISPDSFFQTNTLQAENLYKIIKEYAEIEDNTVWDLYCGAGSIAIFLSENARSVTGFEIVENAVKDARRNAELNDISNCHFVAGDLRFTLAQHAQNPPEVLICDPPRAGMHKEVVQTIREISPGRIVYVSCNPATMARDLAELAQDYKVIEVQPVDMFPHTYHIESVAKLEKIVTR
jgi:23S rRNA (uracil1939-C5)-methyltransferase